MTSTVIFELAHYKRSDIKHQYGIQTVAVINVFLSHETFTIDLSFSFLIFEYTGLT